MIVEKNIEILDHK